ncbi:unnamed protein product [Symbiodinium sp. CCMP2592]|nr:unnamed protein product [Symbiodinium sp. CCMP2592]
MDFQSRSSFSDDLEFEGPSDLKDIEAEAKNLASLRRQCRPARSSTRSPPSGTPKKEVRSTLGSPNNQDHCLSTSVDPTSDDHAAFCSCESSADDGPRGHRASELSLTLCRDECLWKAWAAKRGSSHNEKADRVPTCPGIQAPAVSDNEKHADGSDCSPSAR